MKQNIEQILRILDESENVDQFKESINRATDYKFRMEVDHLVLSLDAITDEMMKTNNISQNSLEYLHHNFNLITRLSELGYTHKESYDYFRDKISKIFNKLLVIDDEIVTNNKDDDGEYIEIDYSNLKSNQNYVVNNDNQEYFVNMLEDGKVRFAEVRD